MLRKYDICLLSAALAVVFFLCGCMSVDCVISESYPATEKVEKFDKAVEIPYEYSVIGICQTEGNYTEFSYDDMLNRIVSEGMKNGADGVLILGMRVVPTGRVVQTSPLQTSIDASSAATTDTWEEIGRDFGGGYGSIRSKTFGTAQTYDRIIRARLIRFVRNDKGELILRSKEARNAAESVAPLKKIKDIKKEQENAKAN